MRVHTSLTKLMVFIFYLCFPLFSYSENIHISDNSFIDLRNSFKDSIKSRSLEGTWEFYWNNFYYPEDFKNSQLEPDLKVELPSFWNNYFIEGKTIGKDGYATYKTKILLPHSGKEFSLIISSVPSSYRLFINGKEYKKVGSPGKSKVETFPSNTPHLVPIREDSKELEVIFHVANFHGLWGGFKNPIYIGTNSKMTMEFNFSSSLMLVMFGALTMAGILYLVFYFTGVPVKNVLPLSLMSFAVAFNAIFGGDFYIHPALPVLGWEIGSKLQFLSLYSTFICLILYFKSTYSKKVPTIIVLLIINIMGIFCVNVIFGKYSQFSWQLRFFEILVTIFIFYFLIILIINLLSQKKGAKISLIGYLFLFISIISELFQNNELFLIQTLYILPIGLFFFLLSQSVNIFIEYFSHRKESELLSEERFNYSKILEREIEMKSKVLMEINQDRIDLLKNVVNETKEPMLQINNYIDSVLNNKSKISDLKEFKTNLDKTQKELIDFIDLEKMNIGIFEYTSDEGSNLNQLIKNCLIKNFPSFEQKGSTVNIDGIDETINCHVHPETLCKILHNISATILELCQSNSKIDITVEKLSTNVIIKFQYSGSSLDQETIKSLKHFSIDDFNKYQTLVKRKKLLVIKTIMDNIGGDLNITTQHNINTFTLKIPLIKHNILNKSARNSEDKNGVILVMVTKKTIQESIYKILKADYTIHLYEDRKSASSFFESNIKPDIIITDIMLEGRFDLDFFSFFSSERKYMGVPFLFLTKSILEISQIHKYFNGICDSILHPYQDKVLHDKIKALLDHSLFTQFQTSPKINQRNMNLKVDENFKKQCDFFDLTNRQEEIVKLIIQGNSNKEIGWQLNISINTVARHIQNIFEKTSATSRVEIINIMLNHSTVK